VSHWYDGAVVAVLEQIPRSSPCVRNADCVSELGLDTVRRPDDILHRQRQGIPIASTAILASKASLPVRTAASTLT
jgi:hypothetical protein